jgi:hypothetical protein
MYHTAIFLVFLGLFIYIFWDQTFSWLITSETLQSTVENEFGPQPPLIGAHLGVSGGPS